MFTSAINYLAGAASSVAGGTTAASAVGAVIGGAESGSIGQDDPLVGSVIEVGDVRVFIRRRIGEGGFAFVYHAEDMNDRTKTYALKRLLAMDQAKRQQIIQEISILKGLSSHEHIVTFVTAATVNATARAAAKCDEFLVLMEFCPKNLADIIQSRTRPYPPETVAKIFCHLVQAVLALHTSRPPIIHRDVKLENLLIDAAGKKVKLCDFGSATTMTYHPSSDWSMSQRTTLEDEMAQHTTPMYRAPEMLDLWSNYPIDTAADVWALGCTLFFLCFNQHPFDDSAKLAIVNGNYRIPAGDTTYAIFHDLIKQMLAVDPSCRPTCQQILEHLTAVSIEHGIDVTTDIDFELSTTPSTQQPVSTFYDMSPQESSNNSSPQHRPAPQVPAMGGGVGLISSLKGGAGNLIHKLRDTSKAVIQTVAASGRGLDVHCITERVAAMSFPSDGFESAFRHHIDDVSAVIENCHSGHYTVVNLTERRYNVAKFVTGNVLDAGWKTSGPTSLQLILDTTEKCLKFLQKDQQNVIVIHCLDGKTNSAVLVASILLACKFVSTFRDALRFFELKRCTPNVDNYHKTVLKYIEKIYTEKQIISRSVILSSIILEPVPLFSKQGDGCKPFIQIVRNNQSDEVLTIPSNDFTALQTFTSYDEEVMLKLNNNNISANGDVSLSIFHARQSFGGLFSKMDGVLIAKLYFHTAFLPTTGSCIRFKLSELDGTTATERYGVDFKVVINYRPEKEPPVTRPVSVEWDTGLIFGSKADFESSRAMMFGMEAPSRLTNPSTPSPPPPVAPPRTHKAPHGPPPPAKPEQRRTPSPPVEAQPQLIADLLVDPGHEPPPPTQPKTAKPAAPAASRLLSESNPLTRPASDTLLLDLGFGGNAGSTGSNPSVASANQSVDILLNLSGAASGSDPFFKQPHPHQSMKPVSSAAELFGNLASTSGNNSSRGSPVQDFFGAPVGGGGGIAPDLFGGPSTQPDLFSTAPGNGNHRSTGSSQLPDLFRSTQPQQQPPRSSPIPDLFGTTSRVSNAPDLFSAAGMSSASVSAKSSSSSQMPDLFGDSLLNFGGSSHGPAASKPVLSPTNLFPQQAQSQPKPKSVGDELLSNLLGDLDMKSGPAKAASAAGGSSNNLAGASNTQRKPNYNSAFFATPQSTSGTGKPKVTENTFNDLLGGFSANNGPGGSGGTRSIGEMKKKEEMKYMDPNEARVHQWKAGKSRNLRALLCSLDTVIWQDSRWTSCGMHQLVSQSDVKKMYKKACLAVHPDKQTGTANEDLAKLIFMELNDAWSEFEKQSEQMGM